jgi:hypothetical protein
MKFLLRLSIIAAMLVMLSACSSTPGNNELETLVKPTLANPLWDVVSIHKLDGNVSPEGKALGVEVYDVKYEYEVKFKKGLIEMRAELKKVTDEEQKKVADAKTKAAKTPGMDGLFARADIAMSAMAGAVFDTRESELDALKKEHGDFKIGEIKKLTGTASFLKTEKGWKL